MTSALPKRPYGVGFETSDKSVTTTKNTASRKAQAQERLWVLLAGEAGFWGFGLLAVLY